MKKIFRKIHLYMALFTIPVGIMIAITGALYVLGADQNTGAEIKTYTVNQIIQEVGSENSTYFYKLSKKTYHCTPREFSKCRVE